MIKKPLFYTDMNDFKVLFDALIAIKADSDNFLAVLLALLERGQAQYETFLFEEKTARIFGQFLESLSEGKL